MNAWSSAFLAQACSDFAASAFLAGEEGQVSQSTMLLQMAFEKLAKAALATGTTWNSPQRSHQVIQKFASVLRKAPGKHVASALGVDKGQLRPRLAQLELSLVELEKLTPALAQGENAEYPWQSPDGAIRWPASDLTPKFCSPRDGARVRKDFQAISARFRQLFA